MAETFTAGAAAFDALRKRGRSGVLTSAAIGYTIGMIVLLAAFAALAWNPIGVFAAAYYNVITASLQDQAVGDPNDPRFIAVLQAMGGLAGSA